MSRIARTESVGDSLCPVCHEQSEIYAIGPCDHPICYRCSTRMRVLCDQVYCPICRGDLPQIVFLTTKQKYDEVNRRNCIPNRKFKILLEDESVEDAYEALLEYRCRTCDAGPLFNSFDALKSHMSRTHTLFPCDLCVNHLKIFPFERKFYNRKDLATHRRIGDADNRSYRGHPLCRFCDERYMDNDELFRHLRQDHFFCHFCDAHNTNEYFDKYPDLREHFRREHFLCEEDHCGSPETRLTHAFNSEIDLKAHIASEHRGSMSRAQAKELRTIDISFQVAPRRRGRDANGISSEDYEDLNTGRNHRGAGGRQRRNDTRREAYTRPDNHTPPPEASSAPSPRPPVLEEDFPRLGNIPPPYVPNAVQRKPAERVEDFPSLSSHQRQHGSAAVTTSSLVSNTSQLVKSNSGPRPGSQKPSSNFSTIAATVTSAEVSRPSSAQSRPVEVSHPAPTVTVTKNTWSAPRLASGEDFPTLGGDKKSKSAKDGPNYVSLGAWSKKQKDNNGRLASAKSGKHPPPSSGKPPSLAALGRAWCDDGEFPTLGGGGAGPDTQPGTWIQKNKNKNNKPTTPLGKTRDTALLNTKSKADSPVLVNGTSESKTEETKSKKKKKKLKGKEDDVVTASEDSGISLSSVASEIDAIAVISEPKSTTTETEEQKKDNSPVLSSFSDNSMNESASCSFESRVAMSSSETESHAKGKENQKWETVGMKKSKLFRHQEEDFPTLQALPKKTAPPPGFQTSSKVAAPPPGLIKPAPSWGRTPPGLGATSSQPPSTSPLGSNEASIPMSVKLNMYVYASPSDLTDRNRALVVCIRQILDEKVGGFDQFRTLSTEFRSGQLSAQEYHQKCQELLGKERFLEVLSELVALLPDILKQHELAQAHRQDILGVCAPLNLQACPTCHQLLKMGDLNAHLSTHANLALDVTAAGFATLPMKT